MTQAEEFDAVLLNEVGAGAPGAAVAVMRDGEFIHRKAYGLADLEWGTPLSPDCSFRIASLTKQFTAAAIMRMVDQAALSIDDPLELYLPAFNARGRRVTLRSLLNHTSGIRNHDVSMPRRTERANVPRQDVVDACLTAPFDFEPGERYAYCNSGYLLLGAVIEAIGGRSFEAHLQAEFFEPLGMMRTVLSRADAIIPQRAHGYVLGRSGFHNARPDAENWSHSAGGLASTLDDLSIWDQALRSGRVVEERSFAQMIEPTRLNDGTTYPYGFGWGTATYGGQRLHHHTGGISGFACQMARLTDEALTTIVLSNLYLFPFDRITRGLLRTAMGLSRVVAQGEPAGPEMIRSCAGRFINRDGGAVTIGTLSGFYNRDRRSFRDPRDPEIEFCFSDMRDGLYHELTYISPLWPPERYVRDQVAIVGERSA